MGRYRAPWPRRLTSGPPQGLRIAHLRSTAHAPFRHPQSPTAKIEPIFGVVPALMLLAACSQDHASQSSHASASPDPELCANKGPNDSYTFGYVLGREM